MSRLELGLNKPSDDIAVRFDCIGSSDLYGRLQLFLEEFGNQLSEKLDFCYVWSFHKQEIGLGSRIYRISLDQFILNGHGPT